MKQCGCATRGHTMSIGDESSGIRLAYGWSAICMRHWKSYMSQSCNDEQLALDIFHKVCEDEEDNERQRVNQVIDDLSQFFTDEV